MSYGQAPAMATAGHGGQHAAGGGYIEHIHRHHGHGHGHHGAHGGASHGQQPLANVAASQVGNTLGPGMASNMITQGTSAGVGATNATMGMGRTMTGGRI